VREEETVRIIFSFDLSKPGVVVAPVGTLTVGFEEVALRDVGSTVGGDGAELVHATMHGVRGFAALRNVGLVIGNSGIRRALAVGDDGERKSAAHGWIHSGVLCGLDGLQRRAGEPLIKMKLHLTEAGS